MVIISLRVVLLNNVHIIKVKLLGFGIRVRAILGITLRFFKFLEPKLPRM